ncbi:pilus assembly PilX family protein [Paraburkholderia kururiensis]|uniref:pilus assembly PilX family protein n=1 Tax=Paraburkholderia kururiensis TaxID=984307 RepID=UPI0020D1029C|nr:pilus assembly protein [Paraburkholderia kururiensis]
MTKSPRMRCLQRQTQSAKPPLSAHTATRVFRADGSKRGAALPVVLVVISTMLVSSAAWLEMSLMSSRQASAVADHLQAFQAADAALTVCARRLVSSHRPNVDAESVASLAQSDPQNWKSETWFESNAFAPVPQWPGSIAPPQCVVEAWSIASRPQAGAFAVTARGYGATRETQAWLQLQLVIEDGHLERHWRRIAARPF